MRLASLVVLALVATPLVAGEAVLDDPEGDVEAFVAPGDLADAPGVAVPGAVDPSLDLRALDVTDTEDSVVLDLTVTDLTRAPAFATFDVTFTRGDVEYRVRVYHTRPVDTDESRTWATLDVADERGTYRSQEELDATVDDAAGRVSVSVPRVLLLDGDARPPQRGDALPDLRVEARFNGQANDVHFGARDLMPDAGGAPGAFTFVHGDAAVGHLELSTPDPVRVSNGASTTFVFRADLANGGDADDRLRVNVTDVPADWSVRVEPERRVPAGESRPVIVLATVPFRHEHGGFEAFNVTATSGNAPDVTARLRFGVLYTPVPQPTGHHPTLHLHARDWNPEPFGTVFPFTDGWLNTEPAGDDEPERVLPNAFADGAVAWRLPLGPALATGLDFDVTGAGVLEASVSGGMGDATVSAELVLVDADGERLLTLANGAPTAIALDPTTPVPFTVTFTPTADADYVPYARDRNLVLVVSLDADMQGVCCFPAQTSPGLHVPGFRLALPLREYHDRLSDVPGLEEAIVLEPLGPVNRTGVPGVTLTYPFRVTHRGTTTEAFNVTLAGADAPRGVVVPRERFTLEPFESRDVLVGVAIPMSAVGGQVLEVIVVAASETDPGKLAVGRTETRVDPDADFVNEARHLVDAEDRERPTPGVGFLAGVAVAGALALAARREP